MNLEGSFVSSRDYPFLVSFSCSYEHLLFFISLIIHDFFVISFFRWLFCCFVLCQCFRCSLIIVRSFAFQCIQRSFVRSSVLLMIHSTSVAFFSSFICLIHSFVLSFIRSFFALLCVKLPFPIRSFFISPIDSVD